MSEVAPLAWRQIAIDPEETYAEFGVRSFSQRNFFTQENAWFSV